MRVDMMSLWSRLPVVVRAVVIGLALATIVTVPWAVLAQANFRYWSAVPWAVPVTALYLWLWWQYVSGKGWPQSTAQARRRNLRAHRISEEAWGAAIVAGILGITTALLILGITNRLVQLPQQPVPAEFSQIPVTTLVSLLFMGAAVAGIVEEASFRGYMQVPIERRHGPVVAIVVTGTLFGLAHFTHPGVLVMLPFYFAVGATYGAMAYLTNSILPGLILHATGDAMGGLMVLAQGRSVSSQPIPVPLGGTAIDASFWIRCVALIVVAAATVWAFKALAAVARPSPELDAIVLVE